MSVMKVCVVQPGYSFDFSKSDDHFRWEMDALDKCDKSMDLIVFPEYSNVPCYAKTKKEMEESYHKYNAPLMAKASETAKRCKATLFINGIRRTETGFRNTTTVFDQCGAVAGHYDKQHLVPSEIQEYQLEHDYTLTFSEPAIIETGGVRYGFLICYDSYFYEAFSNLARYNPDAVIVCSHQRSDPHDALEMISKFCAYHCDAYVIRSSVSLGAGSGTGGGSMIVAPDGTVLVNMKNETGLASAVLDIHQKHRKPAGFGNPRASHPSYIESGRRPWKYRPGGSAIVCYDGIMPYPRICAHRGFNTIAPENSLPAFGAAIALGAEEIEFDLWTSKDGQIVSAHDENLDRVSDGTGLIADYTYEELRRLDFGCKRGKEFEGLRIPRLEDILEKFACQAIMNIHIKTKNNTDPLPEETLNKIIAAIDRYDCRRHSYFMSGNTAVLKQLRRLAPDIARCAGAGGDPKADLVEKALSADCKKIQLFKPHFGHNDPDYLEKTIEKAHANGIVCNLFWSDDPEETAQYLKMGIDTVLTNDYQRNAGAQKKEAGAGKQ